MEYGIDRNGSGYFDPTAFDAIKNTIKSEDIGMELYEGDIVEFELNNGSIKEAVILSVHDKYSTILPLIDNEKLPYSVKCKGVKFTDTGMLNYVYNDKVVSLVRSMTKDEIDDLLQAVVDGLGYKAPAKMVAKVEPKIEPKIEVKTQDEEKDVLIAQASLELTKTQAERDVYKSLYENLISSMMAR